MQNRSKALGRTFTTRSGRVTRELILATSLVGALCVVTLWGALGGTSPAPVPEREPSPAASTSAGTTVMVGGGPSATGGDVTDEEWAQYVANGTKLYGTTCVACHGPGAVGMPGLGKALIANEFVKSQDDDALLAFIQKGRDPSDPLNTTGVGMPPKGGNPALSEDDILDIIAYLRTLQGA